MRLKKKCRYIIESLLTIPKPEKQPLCRIKVVGGPGKFNPLRLRPLWQNKPFANQCKLILPFDIDHRRPPSTTPSLSPQLSDTYCNFTGHLIRYLVHNKSIVISKKRGGQGGKRGGGGFSADVRSQAGALDDATLSASSLISSVVSRPFYLFLFIELHCVCSSGQTEEFQFLFFFFS